MRLKPILILLAFLTGSMSLAAKTPDPADEPAREDTAYVNKLLERSKAFLFAAPDTALTLTQESLALSEKLNYLPGKALALKNSGLALYAKGKYVESLESFQEALDIYGQINDQTGVANMLSNMAAIYGEQGNEVRALELGLRSLSISEKLGNKLRILTALNAIAGIYFNKVATREKALDYLLRALPLCEEINDSAAIGTISENIGEIYLERKEFDSAIGYFEKSINALGNAANSSFAYNGIGKVYQEKGNYLQAFVYHNKALQIAQDQGSKPMMVKSLYGLANVYEKRGDYKTAIKYYRQGIDIGSEINVGQDLKDLYQDVAKAYEKIADYKNAFKYQALYADIKDTLYNIDTDKKLGALQFEFDLQKKQNEINLLTKDKDLQEVKIKRQRLAKNAFIGGFALILIIAFIIYRNYRSKVKVNKILDSQKVQIENLLLNILPAEVATELQRKGYATPKYYESASVLFTDYVGFTKIADGLTPQEIVAELNDSFIAFDEIIKKYNLEKIKTIGDAYMCAGGIPVLQEGHPVNIVKAALEIEEYMHRKNLKRESLGLPEWQLRIGIHVGPLVAGVVGKNKYAYDIWGSTVNIASRMESNGKPGQVNISSATYEVVKDRFHCTHRGKISAKNIGEIDMYFVDGEIGTDAGPEDGKEQTVPAEYLESPSAKQKVAE